MDKKCIHLKTKGQFFDTDGVMVQQDGVRAKAGYVYWCTDGVNTILRLFNSANS